MMSVWRRQHAIPVAQRSGDEHLSISLFSGIGEIDEEGQPVDGDVTVSGVLAKEIGVTVLKTEVVEGGNGESSPGSGTNETVPSVENGLLELLWEDGSVGLLQESEGEKGELDELVGHLDITVHGACEITGVDWFDVGFIILESS